METFRITGHLAGFIVEEKFKSRVDAVLRMDELCAAANDIGEADPSVRAMPHTPFMVIDDTIVDTTSANMCSILVRIEPVHHTALPSAEIVSINFPENVSGIFPFNRPNRTEP